MEFSLSGLSGNTWFILSGLIIGNYKFSFISGKWPIWLGSNIQYWICLLIDFNFWLSLKQIGQLHSCFESKLQDKSSYFTPTSQVFAFSSKYVKGQTFDLHFEICRNWHQRLKWLTWYWSQAFRTQLWTVMSTSWDD